MVLARDVLDTHGRVLITSGTVLRPEILRSLRNYNLVSVWVQEQKTSNTEILAVPELIDAATKHNLICSIQSVFYSDNGFGPQIAALQQEVQQIVKKLVARQHLLMYFNDIHYKSDYLFIHSVNVGVYAMVLGLFMGLSHEEVCLLGMGGLLHDFGKTHLDKDILDKEGPLTIEEFNHIKEHAAMGYSILKVEAKLDYRILLMALQHHERCDGKGYPWGIYEREIHPLAKVVAVADVYDALTSDRIYRPRIPAYEALAMMNRGAGTQFDAQIIKILNSVTVPYPIGTTVKLDNGLRGAVMRINSQDPARPIVWTERGTINLFEQQHIKILSAL